MIRDPWYDDDGTVVFLDSVVRVRIEKLPSDSPSDPHQAWCVIADLDGGHVHVIERYPIPNYGDKQTRDYPRQEAEWGRNRFVERVMGYQS